MSSLWSKGGAVKGDSQVATSQLSPEDDPHTIHIFTVASGHMYERLQKIMVLSVLRNTKCPPFPCPFLSYTLYACKDMTSMMLASPVTMVLLADLSAM